MLTTCPAVSARPRLGNQSLWWWLNRILASFKLYSRVSEKNSCSSESGDKYVFHLLMISQDSNVWHYSLRIVSLESLTLWLCQFSSVAQLCPALCNPMDCSMPGFPVHHQPPEHTQTHVQSIFQIQTKKLVCDVYGEPVETVGLNIWNQFC